MLQSQVNYWTLKENERTHKENEAILWANNAENIRHNYAVESLNTAANVETRRHNIEQESLTDKANRISNRNVRETIRYNKARQKLTQREIDESIRHNKATEAISKLNVDLGYANVGLGYSQLSETTRSHKASESLTEYSNTTSRYNWAESIRSHKASESLTDFSNRTNYENAVTSRENAITSREQLRWETYRYLGYQYPLDRVTKSAEATKDLTQAFKNIAGVVSPQKSALSEWIGK